MLERVAAAAQVVDDVRDVGLDPPRQQEAVVQLGAPADERPAVRLGPEARDQRAHEQRLDERHLRVRRHLEAAQLDDAEAPGLRAGVEQLVDAELGAVGVAGEVGEQVAQQAVHLPRRRRACRRQPIHLRERDLELVERLVASLVDARRLARRADEAPGEEVGQRRVVLPVRDQAAQQVGPAQEGAVGRRGATEREVAAAAGSRMGAVGRELLAREAGLTGVGGERRRALHELRPRPAGVDVDLDDAGVRRDRELHEAPVARHRVALDDDRHAGLLRRGLDDRDELDGVPGVLEWGQEDVRAAVAQLDAERGDGRWVGGRGLGRAGGRGGVAVRRRGGQGRDRLRQRGLGLGRRRGPGQRAERQSQAHR